jgi:hypothetical protein
MHTTLLIGLVILIIASLALGLTAMPGSPALTHDSAIFLNAAQNLAYSGHLQTDMSKAGVPQPTGTLCAYMPGYSLALSLPLVLGLNSLTAMYALTLLGLAAFMSLFYVLTWQLTRSFWAALIAGVWVLFFPPLLDALTYALTESLFIPLTAAIFLVAAIYLQSEKPRNRLLILLGFLLAALSMARIIGAILIATVGGVLVLRSLLKRQWRRAINEVITTAVSQAPAGLYLVINYLTIGRPYCATNSAGWIVERTTRAWLAHLVLEDFKPNVSLGLGFRRLITLIGGRVGVTAIFIVLCLIAIVLAWRYRRELQTAATAVATWSLLPIVVFLVAYLGFFFATGDIWATWDFPRYLMPAYPCLILMAVIAGCAIFRHSNSILIRGIILLAIGIEMLGNVQSSAAFLAMARQGRGIEDAATRDHPAISFLRQNLYAQDLLFSTREPTLWYYLHRPVRRLELVQQMKCEQLAKPEPGGRSVFALFPFFNYDGNPTAPGDIAWFKQWISPCGQVIESSVLADAAVYIVEPTQK